MRPLAGRIARLARAWKLRWGSVSRRRGIFQREVFGRGTKLHASSEEGHSLLGLQRIVEADEGAVRVSSDSGRSEPLEPTRNIPVAGIATRAQIEPRCGELASVVAGAGSIAGVRRGTVVVGRW